MCISKDWVRVGAVLAGLAVMAGAYAAHGLDRQLRPLYGSEQREVAGAMIPAVQKYVADFKTGAEYQMYHALGMIAVGLLEKFAPSRRLKTAGWLFLGAIVIFSGGLYLLVLTGQRWLGAIVPIGGVMSIIGWFFLASATGGCVCHPEVTTAVDEARTVPLDF